MKKFFLIAAAAALVLSSCSKNEVSENNSESNLIGFSTYTGRATKADGSFVPKGTTALPVGGKFGVYCYHTGATPFATALASATKPTPNFMADQAVTYNGTDKNNSANYTYNPTRYWPADGASNLLSFIAYYPQGNSTITKNITSGLGTYDITVPSTPSTQADFMLSDLVADQTYDSNTPKGQVNLIFHHMLTQVNFQAMTDKNYNSGTQENTVITITGVTLTNVKSKGTLTVASTAAASNWGTTANTPINFSVPLSTTAADLILSDAAKDFTANKQTATANSATFLMVPQTLSDDVVLTVTYTYKTGSDMAITNTKTVKLNTKTAEWKKNQNILYTISVGLKAITFTATVSDWDAQQTVNL
jgi:hypothetical protein